MKFRVLNVVLVIPLLLGLGSPAQARPRDEVMSAAFRCGVIADGRKWLDCIYGSAQPIRAELGLPAVTQAQARLVAVPPAGGQITDQGIRDAVLSAAVGCDARATDRQWLDCYYAAAAPMRSALGLSSAGGAQAGPNRLPQPNKMALALAGDNGGKADHFGLLERPGSPSRIVSRLASYSFDRYGIFTVTLANGQVWRQVTGDTIYAHWKQPAATYMVTITKGALGSYNLRVIRGPGLFKVDRIS